MTSGFAAVYIEYNYYKNCYIHNLNFAKHNINNNRISILVPSIT